MNFEMIGRLKINKETEKFKPYQERTFDSGWANRTLMFTAICGDNTHFLTIQGGTFPNKKDYKVMTFGPNGRDDNGNFIPGNKIEIPWAKRNAKENIEKVAQNRRFVVDLEEKGRNTLLKRMAEKIADGEGVTDEELQKAGLENESEVEAALEKSNSKRHEFIAQWDQAEFMKKVLESDKYKDKKFFIRGVVEKRYSDVNQKWYESIVPQRIYMADPDAEEYSIGNAVMYFNKEALDDGSVDDNGKYYVNGFTLEYDSNRKKNIPAPIQLVISAAPDSADEKTKKLVSRMVKKFKVEDDSWKQYGVEFSMLNGAQRLEITEDMLTEDEKEDLECGLITIDDLRREYGGSVYGDRVQEYRFVKPIRGYAKGVKDTAYADEDFVIPVIEDDELPFDDDDFDDDDDL